MNKCTGCGRELPWPYKTCGGCAQEFFQQVYAPQSDSEIVQKVDNVIEPPKRTLDKDGIQKTDTAQTDRPPIKPREKSPTLLRWFDSDMRQRVLASRIQDALNLAGGKSGLRALKQMLHASRYRDWQSAFDWLAEAGILEVPVSYTHLTLPTICSV